MEEWKQRLIEGKIKEYQYEFLRASTNAIQILALTKKGKQLKIIENLPDTKETVSGIQYQFWIPKRVIENWEIETIHKKNGIEKIVKIRMESGLHYYYTWRKIMEYMEKKGIKVKQWGKKYK